MRTLTAILFLCCSTASAATNWVEDVRYFGRELPKRHMNAFHRITRDDFRKSIAELEARAPTANDSEMFVGLVLIAASVGDSHTNVHIPPSARRLPIGFARFGGTWRVTSTVEPYRAALGARLVAIGKTPIDEAARMVAPLAPQAETEALIRAMALTWLTLGEALHGLGITPSRDGASLTLAHEDGTEFTIDVQSVPFGSKTDWIFASETTPLNRQRVDQPLWFQWIEPSKTVYVMFRRYDEIRARSRELWDFVDAHPVQKLVIDLRANGGGDFYKGRSFIVNEVKKRPGLRVFTLIGVRTGSAAITNAIDLRNAGATLAGAPIGARPNGYSENDEMTLPSSKLVVSYSTRLYKFVPDDVPNIVEPDQTFDMTWEDFKAGRDLALEWALGR